MPVLRSNPTVDKAANAWTRGFAAAVRDAAGDSGRVTPNKAKDMTGAYADNVQNYFQFSGKAWANADTVIDSGANYVRDRMTTAAGADGKLSLADIQKLPADLVDDVLILRGKLKPAKPMDTVALKAALKDMEIDRISEYGKSFDLQTYPASKSRIDILKEVIGYDDLTDDEVNDAFDSTKSGATKAFSDEMKSIGGDERENADTEDEGKDLEKRFVGAGSAAKAFFDSADFKSVELAEHSISEDGDTEHRVLLGRLKDDSWVVLNYTDFPF
jgi:hypothetical protein